MKISEEVWNYLQARLGYTDEEMKKFREDPRNVDVISRAPALLNKTIIFEVVDSHGCNSQHKVGDKLCFDGEGNLVTKLCPKKICSSALASAVRFIPAATELLYAGVDPNEMRFNRIGCSDVGVECGGWGHIVMEVRMEERKRE